jgi:hypothetical protein
MGPPGPPGVCSCNLTTFLNSLTLQDMIPGPPGVPGIDGKAGPPGTSVSEHVNLKYYIMKCICPLLQTQFVMTSHTLSCGQPHKLCYLSELNRQITFPINIKV